MAMSTDPDTKIKSKADQHLTDHTSRYGHLMQVRRRTLRPTWYHYHKTFKPTDAQVELLEIHPVVTRQVFLQFEVL